MVQRVSPLTLEVEISSGAEFLLEAIFWTSRFINSQGSEAGRIGTCAS